MAEERKEAFFLDPDEAISLGNVDYMRKAVTVKRTFPKAKGGGESVKEVSATAVKPVDEKPKAAAPTVSTPSPRSSIIPDPVVIPTETPKTDSFEQLKSFSPLGSAPVFPKMQFTSKTDRQKNDSSLNPFRKMGLSNTVKQSSDRQRNDSNLDKFRKMARRSGR